MISKVSKKVNNKEKENKSEKIIKRSWKKIAIIISIIVILLTGVGVGLYFIFKPEKFNLNSKILNENKISIKEAKNKVLKHEGDKSIGFFFYKEDGSNTNFMAYGDSAGPKGDYSNVEGIGPFSYWLDNESGDSKTDWYAIDMGKNENLEEDLFLKDNGKGGYQLNENMIDGDWSDGFLSENSVTEGSSNWSDATKLELDVKEGKKDDKKKPYKGWKVVSRGDDPAPEPDPPEANITEEEFNISEGSTMIFNSDGKLKGLVNGYDSSTPIDHDNEEEFRTWYKSFFEDFVDLSNYE